MVNIPLAAKAMDGVRVFGEMCESAAGRNRSRPIANDTRVDENVVADSALIVDNTAPITSNMAPIPHGKKLLAATATPVSPSPERYRHVSPDFHPVASITSTGITKAPRHTMATNI